MNMGHISLKQQRSRAIHQDFHMARNLQLLPVDDTFDLSAIQDYLAVQDDMLLDPLGSGTYMICGIPEVIAQRRSKRLSNPRSPVRG